MKKYFKFIPSVLAIILSIISLIVLLKTNIIPTKYIIILTILFIIFNAVYNLLFLKKKKIVLQVLSMIIYLLTIILAIVIIYYASKTNKFISNSFNNADTNYQSTYYIISKNNYTKEELVYDEIYYYKDMNNIDEVKEILEKDNITFVKEVEDLPSLLVKEIILIDKATFLLIPELYNDYDISSYKIIYEFNIDIDLTNEAVGEEEEKDEYKELKANEYYNIFIGGYDFTNTFMDFNMLVTINKTNNELLLTTIPRDYYIKDAFVGKKDKLSDMGSRGIETNMASVANMFGVKIDYYIKINTKSLVSLVDAVGGITYCSDQAYTTSHALVLNTYDDTKGRHLYVKKGCQHVNGIEALTIARERLAFKSGDNQRQKNCAQIMQAILKEMKSSKLVTKYGNVLDAVNGFYTTTIPKELVTTSVKDLLENNNWVIKTQSVTGYGGEDYIFFSTTKDYVMYPNTSSINQAKRKIQGMKYYKLNSL